MKIKIKTIFKKYWNYNKKGNKKRIKKFNNKILNKNQIILPFLWILIKRKNQKSKYKLNNNINYLNLCNKSII